MQIWILLQFRAVAIQLECVGVGQRMDIPDFTVMHHFAYREFDDLARLGAWNFGDLDDDCRHVPGRAFYAYGFTDFPLQRFVEFKPGLQHHKQHHAHVVFPVLTDDDAFFDFFDL